MMTSFWRRTGHALAAGLLLLFLRLAQVKTGFDPATGLSLPSVPGTVLAVCLAFCLAAEPLLHRRASRAHVPLENALAPIGKTLAPLVAGAMLLAAGGGLLAVSSLLREEGASIPGTVTGLLALASGAGLVALARALLHPQEGSVSAAPLLPALFFGVFLVLAVYLPSSTDPVLARYYLQVLAAALTAFAFSQLAGLTQRETTPRGFLITADLAVIACVAVQGDDLSLALRLLFGGCTVTLAVFTFLLREDLPQRDTEEQPKA